MRSNLLSLQQTAKLQDVTSNRLATGLKVSTAIDNPSSYYTSRALDARANDLSALLDSMGQGIQTIKAATDALESGIKFLEQAKATAVKASENSVEIVAKVNDEAELLAAIKNGGAGYIVITSDISLTSAIELKDGQKLVGDNYFAEHSGANRKLSFDFGSEPSMTAITAGSNSEIANLDIEYKFSGTINNTGGLSSAAIRVSSGKNTTLSNLNISFSSPNVDSAVSSNNSAGVIISSSDVKISGIVNIKNDSVRGRGIYTLDGSEVELTSSAKVSIETKGEASYGFMVYRESVLNVMDGAELNVNSSGTRARAIHNSAGSEINLRKGSVVNLKSENEMGFLNYGNSVLNAAGKLNIFSYSTGIYNYNHATSEPKGGNTTNILSTAEVFIETLTSNAITNGFAGTLVPPQPSTLVIEAGAKLGMKYQANTTYLQADARYETVNKTTGMPDFYRYDTAIAGLNATGGWGVPDWAALFAGITFETFDGDARIDVEKTNSGSFKQILTQYDQLINDSSYKGVNLLMQNNLKINFNEERSAGIEVAGVDATAKGIGISANGWETQMDVFGVIEELENGVNTLRSFSAEFGNYYAIVTNREEFTQNLINVLTEGADKLTLADMNEESANMLALQTRQQLAVNSLSLASQASQSVLKLF